MLCKMLPIAYEKVEYGETNNRCVITACLKEKGQQSYHRTHEQDRFQKSMHLGLKEMHQ